MTKDTASTAATTAPPGVARTRRRDLLAAAAGLAALPAAAAAAEPTPVASADVAVATPIGPALSLSPRHARPRGRDFWRCGFGDLHVRVWAPDAVQRPRTPLVCLHQNPRSSRDFTRLAPHLATDRMVCAVDTPGCGDSDGPDAPPSIEALALAIDAALQDPASRLAGQAVDLFGQHTGATIALELAALRPARVRRLALLGIPFVEPALREDWRRRFVQPRPWIADPGYLGAQWRRSLETVAGLGLADEECLARFADALRAAPRSAWAFDAVFRYPFEERLALVGQPALVIVVDELIAANSRAAAARLAAATIREMPRLDGRALDTAPAALAAVLREFLDA